MKLQRVELRHSRAVIVGAGQGLGRALATALAERGTSLFLVSLTEQHLNETLHIVSNYGVPAIPVVADAGDSLAVKGFMQRAVDEYGAIDILANCQGESQIQHFEDITDEAWRRVISQNLDSVFYTSRFAFRQMKQQDSGGDIVNIGSYASLVGSRQALGYLTAKAGVTGLGTALSREGREYGIRVTTVCPGAMNTPMRWAATPDMPPDSLLDPAEVASLIANLLSQPTATLEYPIVPIAGVP